MRVSLTNVTLLYLRESGDRQLELPGLERPLFPILRVVRHPQGYW